MNNEAVANLDHITSTPQPPTKNKAQAQASISNPQRRRLPQAEGSVNTSHLVNEDGR